jgi:acyl-coenzyme A synthetase/AMP-(fatty) acid ligase
LRDLPEVEEPAVVPLHDPLRREEVKAYLKLREGLTQDDLPPETVFAHCEKRLAKLKIPRISLTWRTFTWRTFRERPPEKFRKDIDRRGR